MKPSSAWVVLTVISSAFAGPLTPPAGAPSPTAKPLSEVEPRIAINAQNTPGDAAAVFRITQPGSYYLTGNVTGVAGKSGILITSSGVTVDLGGFELRGVPGSLTGVASGSSDVAVVNGIVKGWGEFGVGLLSGIGVLVERVVASENGLDGIFVSNSGVVSRCTSNRNGGAGLRISAGTMVTDSSFVANSGAGIVVQGCCVTLSNLIVYDNNGAGIVAASSTGIYDSVITDNTGWGVENASNSTISGCAITFNFAGGARITVGNRVLDSLFSTNFGVAGLEVTGSDNRIDGNTFVRNSSVGLQVNGAGNLVMRNSSSGQVTNWSIGVGNAVAPIVNAATNPVVISGNTYAGSLGTTDPNANFTY